MLKNAFFTAIAATIPLGATALCPGEGTSYSVHSDNPTSLIFINRAESPEDVISVFWLDFHGNRQHYFDLYPGERHHQQTYLTHPWLITFPVPGGGEVCHGIFQPLATPVQIVIR